jgi:endonuclease/exonuclease/phosphatase family metal-dependent hydrolase
MCSVPVGCGGEHASSPAEVTDAPDASGGGDAGGLEDASGMADVGGGSDAGVRGGSEGRWLCDQPQWSAGERQAYGSESWANLQHPPSLRVAAGAPSDPVFGQVWVPGATDQPGAAPGWGAEVLVGPLGTHPYAHGACWRRVPATFNVDVGNNDEHTATLRVDAPGLYAYMMRYGQGAGSPGILGDLDGPNDGARSDRAGVLEVDPARAPEELVVVTLNLRCQADDWPARRPLVLEALARLSPDLIALQEDCAAPGQAPQSLELRAELAARVGRGYAWRRVVTHQAEHEGARFDEGLAVLSAWPLDALAEGGAVDLYHVNFPRKAQAWTMRVGEAPVHVLAAHFDYGSGAAGAREGSARALLEVLPGGDRAVVLGDLNATPDSAAYATLSAALRDLWGEARPDVSGETVPADAPTRRIDYVFASATFGPVRDAVLLDERDGDTWLSDHLGVAVTVAWGP